MTPAIAILLAMTLPHSDAAEYRCDVLEVNHVIDLSCDPPRIGICQLIMRDRAEIRDWRMIGKVGYPSYDWERQCWRSSWVEGGRLIEVRADSMMETFSEEDRELVERAWLPDERRKRINR